MFDSLRDIFKKKREVTLVLGGGSARGIAHIGVLKILEKERIPVHRVVGTSMGALIGAAYAQGMSIEKMRHFALNFSYRKLLDPTLPKMGILAGAKLESIVRELLGDGTFEGCRIPFAVVTTDMEKGEEVVHQQGSLVPVVRASCSWAGVFNPVKIEGKLLSDGGIKNSVPTSIAKRLAPDDYIIAVDVGFCVKQGKIKNILQMMLQSFQIMGEELNKYQSLEANCVIKVDLGDLDQGSFHRAEEAMTKGANAAMEKIGQIKKDLGLQW